MTGEPRAPVCVVTESGAYGGSVVHTMGLIETLVARGVAVDVFANRFDPYTGWVLERGLGDRVRVTHTDLAGILPETRTDVAGWDAALAHTTAHHVVFPKGHFLHGRGDFMRLLGRRFARVVVIEHLEAPPGPGPRPALGGLLPRIGWKWRLRRARRQRAMRHADVIVAVSTKVRDRLAGDWRIPAARIEVVRNGVDWRRFPRDPAAGAAFRAAHALPPGAFVAGMLTRLAPVKGIDVALAAMRLVVDAAPARDVRLVVAGEGPDAAALAAQAARLGLGGHVRFAGAVREPAAALAAFDAIVFSSRLEGLPLALLEGMAAGCVPVVTDIGGMREAVDSPAIGRVVPPEDPGALARALLDVVALPAAEFEAMRGRVQARVRDAFDGEACYARIADLCLVSGD